MFSFILKIKKGTCGRPRGSYSGPYKKDTTLRQYRRLALREYQKQKYLAEQRKRRKKKRIHSLIEISENELKKITTVFIQATFIRFEKSNIYVTNDKVLLRNQPL